MRSGVIRELAADQELHRVLPASFKSERGTVNLYASVEDINNGQVSWRIDSSELTSDLMTAIEMKVAYRCRAIFGQIGSTGRYTQSLRTQHPDLPQCRIGILINVPKGFNDLLKYRKLIQTSQEQEVHLLFWKPVSRMCIETMLKLVESWQDACRKIVPFDKHHVHKVLL